MTDYVPNGRYWAKNVHAVREWAIGLINFDAAHEMETPGGVFEIEDWCRWWIENDPGDAGSYGAYERRNANARKEWREVWADYLRLGGPS